MWSDWATQPKVEPTSTFEITVAPNVLNLPLRPPAVVARAVASLDILSGGRLRLGGRGRRLRRRGGLAGCAGRGAALTVD